MIMMAVLAVISGMLVGFSLGLIGGGGSILATPLLLYVVGVSEPHIAIGTSAVAVSINAYLNFFTYIRSGVVRWRAAIIFATVGSVGALGGSSLGKAFDADRLIFLFGILMLVVGVMMLRPRGRGPAEQRHFGHYSLVVQTTVGLAVGLTSGFFGIGGGFLIVPGLVFSTGMPMINAIGSSLLVVGTFGLATAVNYAASGMVNWPVAAEFIGGGMLGGLGGITIAARLAHRKHALSVAFASVIFVVATYVLWRSWRTLLT
jgi:uncharacterized membrane protein YfcA